jgi:hypothetical protein
MLLAFLFSSYKCQSQRLSHVDIQDAASLSAMAAGTATRTNVPLPGRSPTGAGALVMSAATGASGTGCAKSSFAGITEYASNACAKGG